MKTLLKTLTGSTLAAILLLSQSNLVLAASISGLNNPITQFDSLGDLMTKALGIVFALVALFAVVMFSVGAFRFMVSRGDPKAADSARSTMTGSVIGLIIVLGAASLSGVFGRIFGISLFGGSNSVGPITDGRFDLTCAFQLATGYCVGKDPNLNTFGGLVTQILQLLLAAGGLVFFLMLLWGGLRYMLARGDEKAVSDARSTLTNAGIGLLLMITSLIIIRLIARIVFNFPI